MKVRLRNADLSSLLSAAAECKKPIIPRSLNNGEGPAVDEAGVVRADCDIQPEKIEKG